MFKNEFPEKDKFDEMTIRIESGLFDISMVQSEFILEMFQEQNSLSIDLELEIAVYLYEKPAIVQFKKIYFDESTDSIKVMLKDNSDEILWDELDVTAHEIIINDIHNSYRSKMIVKKLSNNENEETKH